MKAHHIKRFNYFLLFFGVLILIIFLITLDINQVMISLSSITLGMVLMVMSFNVLIIFLKAVRWQILIYEIADVKPSLFFSFLSIIAGVAAGSLTPGRGTEIGKPLMLKTLYKISLTKTIPAMVLERILEFLTIVFFFFISYIIVPKTNMLYHKLIIPAVILSILFILFVFFVPSKIERVILIILKKIPFSPKLKSKLNALVETQFNCIFLLKQKKVAFPLIILSLAGFILELVKFQILFMMFGVKMTLLFVCLSFTGSLIFALLTLVPGGIGVTEISFVAILVKLLPKYRTELLTSVVIVDRMLTYYFLVILGAIILILYRKKGNNIVVNQKQKDLYS